MGKDRLIPVKKVEGHILDHRIVEGAIGKDNIGHQLIPIALMVIHIHSQ